MSKETFFRKINSDRYKVTVEFIVPAESPEDAEQILNELIKEGILVLTSELNEEDPQVIHNYDIINSEPAEIDLDTL